IRLGWHHQIDEAAAGDGSGFDTTNMSTLAGTPSLRPLYHSNVLTFEDQVPASVREACGTGDQTKKCQTSWVRYGGPSLLQRLILDSYQGKVVLTGLFSALGHHVLKGGIEGNISYYDHLRTFGGGAAYVDFGPVSIDPNTTTLRVQDSGRFGYLS